MLIPYNIYPNKIRQIKEVNNEKEFFLALSNNTEIVILCDILDFSIENLKEVLNIEDSKEYVLSYSDLIERKNESYYLSNGIVLHGYKNLKIRSKNHTEIIEKSEFGNILSFKNCKKITLENLSIFHTPETCNGSVLSLISSSHLKIINCSLNGSGGIGVNLIGTDNVTFNHVQIFNNVFYAVESINSLAIVFKNCHIFDNHNWGEALIHTEISNLIFKNCLIENNEAQNLIKISSENNTHFYPKFIQCTFSDNVFNLIENISVGKKLRKKKKTEIVLKLYLKILVNEFNRNHDGSNDRILSFFANDHVVNYLDSNKLNRIMPYYFHLKSKPYIPLVSEINQIGSRTFKVVIINTMGHKEKTVWNISFNRKNKIREFEIEKHLNN